MYTKRTVTINIDTEEQVEMQEVTNEIEWCRAVGYLASWGRMYPRVEIYRDIETDLFAMYYDAEGELAYFIGAMWCDDYYVFLPGTPT